MILNWFNIFVKLVSFPFLVKVVWNWQSYTNECYWTQDNFSFWWHNLPWSMVAYSMYCYFYFYVMYAYFNTYSTYCTILQKHFQKWVTFVFILTSKTNAMISKISRNLLSSMFKNTIHRPLQMAKLSSSLLRLVNNCVESI